MLVAFSVNGVPIRLTDERWAHIVESHDEMAGSRDLVLQAIEQPDTVCEGHDGALVAIRPNGASRNVCVVYRELEKEGFVITAYFCSKAPKGRKVWRKS